MAEAVVIDLGEARRRRAGTRTAVPAAKETGVTPVPGMAWVAMPAMFPPMPMWMFVPCWMPAQD